MSQTSRPTGRSDRGQAQSRARVVYTDGACSGNPGPGGWAWAVPEGPSDSGGHPDTTNQRMELQAVLEALGSLEGPLEVHSDSTYVVHCFNDRWYEGWLQRNWRNAQRKPVANRDLWEPLVEMFINRIDELKFYWVKAHSGDAMNDLVDAMAVAEIDRIRSGGPARPFGSAEASIPAGGQAAQSASLLSSQWPAPPWSVQRAVAVTGASELDDQQLVGLHQAIDRLEPDADVVVSGLRRGAELMGAERALARGLPLGVVLPFADPAGHWPRPIRKRFDACLEAAGWVVTLEGDRTKPGRAVSERNRWLWTAVVGAIVVADAELARVLDQLGLGVVEVD